MKQAITSILTSVLFLACNRATEHKEELNMHSFDQTAISKLPVFDSIRKEIIYHYNSYQFGGAYNSFTFNYYFDTIQRADIPSSLHKKIAPLFEEIGIAHVQSFTIIPDSTIEFLISSVRDHENNDLRIRESLFWYNDPNRIKKLSYPKKDTVIGNNWQYVIWYDQKKALM